MLSAGGNVGGHEKKRSFAQNFFARGRGLRSTKQYWTFRRKFHGLKFRFFSVENKERNIYMDNFIRRRILERREEKYWKII